MSCGEQPPVSGPPPGQPPNEPPPQRTGRGRLPRGGVLVSFLGFSLFSLFMIAFGGYNLWAQHSGIPARVELGRCWATGGRAPDRTDCTGVWRQADGTEQTVTVHGVSSHHGQTVDVHIHGHQAYPNSFWRIAPLIGGSVLLGLMLLLALLPERPPRGPRPSLFSRGRYEAPGPDASGPQHSR